MISLILVTLLCLCDCSEFISVYEQATSLLNNQGTPVEMIELVKEGLPPADWPDFTSMAIIMALKEISEVSTDHLRALQNHYPASVKPTFADVCQKYLNWSSGEVPQVLLFLAMHCHDPYESVMFKKWIRSLAGDEEVLHAVLRVLFTARRAYPRAQKTCNSINKHVADRAYLDSLD